MTHGDSDTTPSVGYMNAAARGMAMGVIVDTIIEEWAEHYAGGAKLVRAEYPDRERIFPHELWLKAHTSGGGKVSRRRIIVVEDWTEVAP